MKLRRYGASYYRAFSQQIALLQHGPDWPGFCAAVFEGDALSRGKALSARIFKGDPAGFLAGLHGHAVDAQSAAEEEAAKALPLGKRKTDHQVPSDGPRLLGHNRWVDLGKSVFEV